MVRRWQLAFWVLLGLVLTVVMLWERASTSADRADGARLQTVDTNDGDGTGGPDELAFGELQEATDLDGDNNVLRPTTTTTTTTTTTKLPDGSNGETDEDGNADSPDTTVTGRDDSGSTSIAPTTTGPDNGSTTAPGGSTGGSTPPPTPMTTVYYQNFAVGELVADEWNVYRSVGHEGWGLRRPSAVGVVPDPAASGGHVLQITAGMGTGDEEGLIVSGGMKLKNRSITYGRVSFRARVDPDPDQATAGVVHLWPVDDNWPDAGEINILSTREHRDTRAPVRSDLHWVDGDGHGTIGVDHGTAGTPMSATEWHVYTVEWTANRISVAIDGGEPFVLTTIAERVPHDPLDLAIQLDASDTPDRPGLQPVMSGQVLMQVDWILVEEPVENAG